MDAKKELSRRQVRRVDELAQSRYGLAGLVLMENAGRGAACLIDQKYGPRGSAWIACGTGNNGGDGLVIARHLHNAGWAVRVLIAGNPASMSADCAANDRVIRAMGMRRDVIPMENLGAFPLDFLSPETVVVDALLGTGFCGTVRPPLGRLIERLNSAPKKSLVAIDVPSGLDCDTGQPGGVAARADRTITFVAAKPGFFSEVGRKHVGIIEVVDIGVPVELVEDIAGLGDGALEADK